MNIVRKAFALSFLIVAQAGAAPMAWDGSTTLYDIDFRPENFLDINSYQFRPADEIRWYDVENGWRVASGSLESNRAYLITDIRIKRVITPSFNARLSWSEEELYAPRAPDRPLLELELRPAKWPVWISLLGAPAYAKKEAELGGAVSLGGRPWNYLRIAWLRPDFYFNSKNDFDSAYYRHAPYQVSIEASYRWANRYKLRIIWYDNKPQEFVLADQLSVFSYRNRNYQAAVDYRIDSAKTLGVELNGFHTLQSRLDTIADRSQDIRYTSVNTYWINEMDHGMEWTLGFRVDDFRNRERTPFDPVGEFDFIFKTMQLYGSYYRPYSSHQAWDLGLYYGDISKRRDYRDSAVSDSRRGYRESMLRMGWNIFSIDHITELTLAVSWNLDDLMNDSFDGGSARFHTEF